MSFLLLCHCSLNQQPTNVSVVNKQNCMHICIQVFPLRLLIGSHFLKKWAKITWLWFAWKQHLCVPSIIFTFPGLSSCLTQSRGFQNICWINSTDTQNMVKPTINNLNVSKVFLFFPFVFAVLYSLVFVSDASVPLIKRIVVTIMVFGENCFYSSANVPSWTMVN